MSLKVGSISQVPVASMNTETGGFRTLYAKRVGIEGTDVCGCYSVQDVTSCYFGFVRSLAQHLATALALDLLRVVDWLMGNLEQLPGSRRSSACCNRGRE